MSDPFKIEGPALISFSGGRTSAYMLWRILQAHGGTLPSDVVVAFANTGKEAPETLDFVQACADRWSVYIQWLEYRRAEIVVDRWTMVDYRTASRAGEPFSALNDAKGYLPNPVTRFCTSELKIRPMANFARSMDWTAWDNVIGLRADEQRRVSRSRGNTDPWDNVMPLAEAGIAKADIGEFWATQPFRLELMAVNDSTPDGNCDLCFLKSVANIQGRMRRQPNVGDWWIAEEAKARASKPKGASFNKDRPSYASMAAAVRDQQEFVFEADETIDCLCTID